MFAYRPHPFLFSADLDIENQPVTALLNLMTRTEVVLSREDWQLLQTDPGVLAEDELMAQLIENDIVIPGTADRVKLMRRHLLDSQYHSRCLRFKVLLNRTCNFRCSYCIDHTKSGKMDDRTARDLCNFIQRQTLTVRPEMISLEFSGGETLLNFGRLIQIAAEIRNFCLGLSVEFELGLTTNGSLLSTRKVRRLQDQGLKRLRVSFGGPQTIHDHLRVDRHGQGTYAAIVANLREISPLLQTGIDVECQYYQESGDYLRMPELMEDLEREGVLLRSFTFSPVMPRIIDRPEEAPGFDVTQTLFLKHEIARRGYPVYDELPEMGCAADLEHVYMVDYTGALIPCPCIGPEELVYGNVVDGVDFVAKSQQIRELPSTCLSQCNLAPVCNGFCRLFALYEEGDFNGVHCPEPILRPLLNDYLHYSASGRIAPQPLPSMAAAA